MNFSGQKNKILFVDLSKSTFREETLPERVIENYISGHGVNYWLLSQYIPLTVDALSPENGIILGTGLFNGTPIPGSSQLNITTKFPLTGNFATGCGGGHFSNMMKTSGYDYVIITGASTKPVYLLIAEGSPQILDALDLWGQDGFETVDILRNRHEPCSIIPIGQSGENMVKVSVTAIDKLGTVGAGGLPAVMGYKKLKAIVAARGSQGVEAADGRTLLQLVDDMVKKILAYEYRGPLVEEGAIATTASWRGTGEGFLSPAILDKVRELHKAYRKTLACPSCPIADKESICFSEGPFSGMKSYTTAFMGLKETYGGAEAGVMLGRGFKMVDVMNRLGLDEHNINKMLPVVIKLYKEGKINPSSTMGFALSEEFPSRIELLEMIAHRRGFGNLLADGVDEALKKLDLNPTELTTTVKGYQTLMEPRLNAMGTMEFEMLVNPRGGVTAMGAIGSPSYNPGRPVEQFLKQSDRVGVPMEARQRIFSKDSFNPARLARYAEDWFSLHNMLGLCHRLYISRFHSLSSVTAFYNALTGQQKSGTDLLLASERAWNLWRHLNARLGIDAENDRPPKSWFRPLRIGDEEFTMKDYYGTKDLSETDVLQLLQDYYDERGWDLQTGNPDNKKLTQLGIDV